MRKKWIALGVINACLIVSCRNDNNLSEQLKFNDKIRDLISNYIDLHSQYNTLVIIPIRGYNDLESPIGDGYLLGPGHEELIKNNKLLYFKIDDKRIYYLSDISKLIAPINDNWQIHNFPDSVYVDGIFKKDKDLIFIYNAIYFKMKLDQLIINNRPDTLFIPKKLAPTIQFPMNYEGD